METTYDILKQLQHKRRSVNDLAQIISNMCDEHPNYTLMMGAGCSITSGISTGQDLVKKWKRDIYADYHGEDENDDAFWNRQFSWYDPRNEYSSLFEKKYDLPRQRRIFVEREVSDKNPSIGYAYLVKLVEHNFINAIFTTNFDDLINEAFYRYSNVRPILCAHDSSISSITVTSARPKIIKLHGDYLYDDIKSTLRETESLNDNMKDKFIEFAKDHGLIVVGYAGNDRSIMDILTMLLQRQDYFKYGIYWCIRKGDYIGEELRKLLWKDRVYYVEIGGFDELMAELNDILNDGELPIEDEMLSIKRQKKLIKDLTQNKYFKSDELKNDVIKRDIRQLNKKIDRNLIEDFFNVLDLKTTNSSPVLKSGLEDLKAEERNTLDDVKILLEDHKYDKVCKELERLISNAKTKSFFKFNLLSLKLRLISETDPSDYESKRRIFDELLDILPSRKETYIYAFRSFEDKDVKMEYLNKAICRYCKDIYLYNIKAEYLIDYVNEYLDKVDEEKVIYDINEALDKSIDIDDSSSNIAYSIKCKLYSYIYSNQLDKKKEKIIEVYSKLNQYSYVRASISLNFGDILDISPGESIKAMKNVQKFSTESDDSDLYEKSTIALLRFYNSHGDEEKMIEEMEDYESKFKPSEDYDYIKAKLLLSSFEHFKEGATILMDNQSRGRKWQESLFNYYCNIRNHEKAESLYKEYFSRDVDKKIEFLSAFSMHEETIRTIDDYWNSHPKTVSDLSCYVCALFALGRYDVAFKVLKPYYDNPKFQDGIIYINYFIACIHINRKDISKKIKEKIIDSRIHHDDMVIAGAYALLKDRGKMLHYLKEAIKRNVLYKFDISIWPVFEDYQNDEEFQKLADTSTLNIYQ